MDIVNKYFKLPLTKADIEYLFDRALPEMPEPILINGVYQYPVFVDLSLFNAIEKYMVHLHRIASDPKYVMKIDIFPAHKYSSHTAIDYELNYENKLKALMYTIMEHDTNGMYLNLFFIILSHAFSEAVRQIFHDTRVQFSLNPLVHSFHKRVLDETLETFKKNHPYRYKVNYADFKLSFINFILRDQLAFFTGRSQLLPEHFLADKGAKFFNSRFLLSLPAFKRIRDIMIESLRYLHKNDRYRSLFKRKHLAMPDDGNYERFVYGVRETVFLLQNDYVLLQLAKDRLLKEEADKLNVSLHEMVILYQDIIFAIKRKQVLTALQGYVFLHSITTDVNVLHKRFEEGVVFRFEEGSQVHKRVKEASVFFIDIRNFSQKSRNMNPDELTRQLHLILDPIPDILTDYGGQVDKMLGDGMMALFGVDEENEDHALNAIRAAILVHVGFHAAKQQVVFEHIGIGINTGKISIAQFGQVTAIGQTVNAAARLCSSTTREVEQSPEEKVFEVVQGPTYLIEKQIDSQRFASIQSDYDVDITEKGDLFNIGIAVSSGTVNSIKRHYQLREMTDGKVKFYFLKDALPGRDIVFRQAGRASLKGVGDEIVYDVVWDPKKTAMYRQYGTEIDLDTDEMFKRLMKND